MGPVRQCVSRTAGRLTGRSGSENEVSENEVSENEVSENEVVDHYDGTR